MKKFIAILFSAMLVFGLAASVYAADLKFGGDAYVEGVMRHGYDLDGTNNSDDDYRYWDQRVRLKFDAVLENGIEVRTRLRVSDAKWNGATETRLGDNYWSTKADPTAARTVLTDGVSTDYAYLHVPIGPVTVDAGHMLASWGLGFWGWNTEVDRVVASLKLGTATLGGFVRKDTELLQGDNEGDQDSYSLFAKINPNDSTEAGVIAVYTQNQPNNNDDHPLQDGWTVDAYGKTKMGIVTLMSEMVFKTGFMFATGTEALTVDGAAYTHNNGWNNQFGGKVAAVVDLAPVTVTGAFAIATNNFVADNDFTPTYFFGTSDNPLAIMEFQSMDEDRTTWALVGMGSYKISDTMTAGAKIAYAELGMTVEDGRQDGDGDLFSITEFDASFDYQISKSTKYTVGAVLGVTGSVPESMSTYDDNIYGMFHKLAISF